MNPTRLSMPLSEQDVRALSVGERVLLTGELFSARDAVHSFLSKGGTPPCDLTDAVIYHCGPVVIRKHDQWVITAAGPTTSMREEPYMAGLIQRFNLRAVIGKGGMGIHTLEACRQHGCVYLHAVGGAAQVLARTILSVKDVFLKETFGAPEAIWKLNVRDFPAVVTMDAHGSSLHADVAEWSEDRLNALLATDHHPQPTS